MRELRIQSIKIKQLHIYNSVGLVGKDNAYKWKKTYFRKIK